MSEKSFSPTVQDSKIALVREIRVTRLFPSAPQFQPECPAFNLGVHPVILLVYDDHCRPPTNAFRSTDARLNTKENKTVGVGSVSDTVFSRLNHHHTGLIRVHCGACLSPELFRLVMPTGTGHDAPGPSPTGPLPAGATIVSTSFEATHFEGLPFEIAPQPIAASPAGPCGNASPVIAAAPFVLPPEPASLAQTAESRAPLFHNTRSARNCLAAANGEIPGTRQDHDESPLLRTRATYRAMHPVRPARRRGFHEKRNAYQRPPA
ncbi:hypothetical protein SAMN05421753_106158 [Planctomicrobium piriforme]|uniref:Uncharacterized protein n=1 Tax=Planctomicrobium piriforme TaxID=1576369 RepID=A0A1I3G371_9PLAN|nr:hypothetical protein SAMN05421753_106158 [Planctomicrobium piriforme]